MSTTVSSDSTGGQEIVGSASALAVNGVWVLFLLLWPISAAAAPMLARGRGWQPTSIAATAVLGLFALLSALTLGLLFVPALLAAVAAVFFSPRGMGGPAAAERPGG